MGETPRKGSGRARAVGVERTRSSQRSAAAAHPDGGESHGRAEGRSPRRDRDREVRARRGLSADPRRRRGNHTDPDRDPDFAARLRGARALASLYGGPAHPGRCGRSLARRPEDRKVTLRKGDTIAIPPELPHSFRVVGDEVLRLLGTHASPKRIVNYRDVVKSDARGYRVLEP